MCKEPVSGLEWYNPDGQIVMVPYINTRTQMEGKDTIYMSNTSLSVAVSAEVCSTAHVTLDGRPYSLLNCELTLHPELLFLTLYISPENDIIGGVTVRREFDEYLNVTSPGFLLDRWSFATVGETLNKN